MTAWIVGLILGGLLAFSIALHCPHKSRSEGVWRFVGAVCFGAGTAELITLALKAVLT